MTVLVVLFKRFKNDFSGTPVGNGRKGMTILEVVKRVQEEMNTAFYLSPFGATFEEKTTLNTSIMSRLHAGGCLERANDIRCSL